MTNTTKQHTPGPWQVGYRDGSGPECIVQYLGDGDRPKLIAMIGFHGDPELRGDMTPEERANAELIAQAPALAARVAELEDKLERLAWASEHLAGRGFVGSGGEGRSAAEARVLGVASSARALLARRKGGAA